MPRRRTRRYAVNKTRLGLVTLAASVAVAAACTSVPRAPGTSDLPAAAKRAMAVDATGAQPDSMKPTLYFSDVVANVVGIVDGDSTSASVQQFLTPYKTEPTPLPAQVSQPYSESF